MTEDLAGIVMRGSQLGYSPWRVGIALGVAPSELAAICARLDEHATVTPEPSSDRWGRGPTLAKPIHDRGF